MSSGLAVVVLSLPFALAEGMSVSAGGIPGGAQPQAVPAAEYAGETTCLGCHEDKAYKGTAHSLALKERTPAANHGCESCHGPGQAHAESGDPALIKRFTRTGQTPAEGSDTCTSCHNRASHALWDGSQRFQRR